MNLISWLSAKLERRLVWPSLLMAVGAVSLMSFISYYSARELLRTSISNQLQVAVNLQEGELRRWVEDQKTRVDFICRAPAVRERVADLLTHGREHPSYAESRRVLSEYLFSYLKHFPALREVTVYSSRNGEVVFSTRPDGGDGRLGDRDYFKQGRQHLVVQGVYVDHDTGEPTITVARPLLDATGEKQGVLAVHLNLQRLEEVINAHPGLGRTGVIILVEQTSRFINTERPVPSESPLRPSGEGLGQVRSGEEGLGFYRNRLGVPVVGYFRWQPELGVAILAEIDQSEAFGPAGQIGITIAGVGFLLTVLLVAGNIFFARRVAAPLRMMSDTARKIADGDFTMTVPLAGRDETGVLADAFNRMIAQLRVLYRKLENSAEYFRTIFNLSPLAIAVQRHDNGTFVNVNERFCDMFDIPHERVLGRTPDELKIWRSDFSRRRLAALLKRDLQVDEFEADFVRRGGETFRGVVSSRRVDLAEGALVISVLLDIGNLRRAEQELQKTTDRLQLLISRMPMACIAWNADLTVGLWNPGAERIFGYTSEEAVDRHAYDLIVPADVRPQVATVWRKLLEGDETAHSENRNVTRDGRIIMCDWYNTPLADERGEAIGVISMVRDITEEKAAAESLKHQKELLQTILNAIPTPIFFKDASGIYQGCNDAFCDYLGLPFEQIVGHTVYDVAPADKARIYEEADRKLIGQGGVQIYEAQVRFADGSDRDVIFHKAVFRNPDGSAGGLVGNMLDVTEIRRAEADLAESEQNYREIFNASSEAIIIRDFKTGEVVDVNQAMLDMYGYSRDEALRTTIDDLTSGDPPYTVEKAYENMARAKAGEDRLFEWKAKRKDGARFWVEIALKKSRIRGEDKTIAVIRDITERKEAERIQRESEERFQLLVEHAADALFLHDEEGIILTVNQRACDNLGYSRHELLGMRIDQVERGVRIGHLQEFWNGLDTGQAASFEGEHQRRDGSRYPVDVNVVRFEFQKSHFFLAMARDISERKATELELERYRGRLEELVKERTRQLEVAQDELVRKERLAVLGQLTATVSHELRNPLGTIKNALYLLGQLRDGAAAEKIEATLALADRNVMRCDGIINELLDYTRQHGLSLAKVPVRPWLEEILAEQRFPGGIETSLKCPQRLAAVFDSERMRRVVNNILNNSVQALAESPSRPKTIRVEAGARGRDLVLTITDSGPGIPENILDRIFEPMFSTRNFGVGLGMTIVRNIVEEHGGDVTVSSRSGVGTTVTLSLPREAKKQKIRDAKM